MGFKMNLIDVLLPINRTAKYNKVIQKCKKNINSQTIIQK